MRAPASRSHSNVSNFSDDMRIVSLPMPPQMYNTPQWLGTPLDVRLERAAANTPQQGQHTPSLLGSGVKQTSATPNQCPPEVASNLKPPAFSKYRSSSTPPSATAKQPPLVNLVLAQSKQQQQQQASSDHHHNNQQQHQGRAQADFIAHNIAAASASSAATPTKAAAAAPGGMPTSAFKASPSYYSHAGGAAAPSGGAGRYGTPPKGAYYSFAPASAHRGKTDLAGRGAAALPEQQPAKTARPSFTPVKAPPAVTPPASASKHAAPDASAGSRPLQNQQPVPYASTPALKPQASGAAAAVAATGAAAQLPSEPVEDLPPWLQPLPVSQKVKPWEKARRAKSHASPLEPVVSIHVPAPKASPLVKPQDHETQGREVFNKRLSKNPPLAAAEQPKRRSSGGGGSKPPPQQQLREERSQGFAPSKPSTIALQLKRQPGAAEAPADATPSAKPAAPAVKIAVGLTDVSIGRKKPEAEDRDSDLAAYDSWLAQQQRQREAEAAKGPVISLGLPDTSFGRRRRSEVPEGGQEVQSAAPPPVAPEKRMATPPPSRPPPAAPRAAAQAAAAATPPPNAHTPPPKFAMARNLPPQAQPSQKAVAAVARPQPARGGATPRRAAPQPAEPPPQQRRPASRMQLRGWEEKRGAAANIAPRSNTGGARACNIAGPSAHAGAPQQRTAAKAPGAPPSSYIRILKHAYHDNKPRPEPRPAAGASRAAPGAGQPPTPVRQRPQSAAQPSQTGARPAAAAAHAARRPATAVPPAATPPRAARVPPKNSPMRPLADKPPAPSPARRRSPAPDSPSDITPSSNASFLMKPSEVEVCRLPNGKPHRCAHRAGRLRENIYAKTLVCITKFVFSDLCIFFRYGQELRLVCWVNGESPQMSNNPMTLQCSHALVLN